MIIINWNCRGSPHLCVFVYFWDKLGVGSWTLPHSLWWFRWRMWAGTPALHLPILSARYMHMILSIIWRKIFLYLEIWGGFIENYTIVSISGFWTAGYSSGWTFRSYVSCCWWYCCRYCLPINYESTIHIFSLSIYQCLPWSQGLTI